MDRRLVQGDFGGLGFNIGQPTQRISLPAMMHGQTTGPSFPFHVICDRMWRLKSHKMDPEGRQSIELRTLGNSLRKHITL